MEFKEREYVHPLKGIASELLGPSYFPSELEFYPAISPYTDILAVNPALQEALSTFDRQFFDPSQYAHRVASKYMDNLAFSSPKVVTGVSYAVAHAIITDNELLQRHNPTSVRILFDLALDKILTSLHTDRARDELRAAHGIDEDAPFRLKQLDKKVAPFIRAQQKLRERLSITPPGMRK